MRYEPRTAKEIDEANLFPLGEYDFEVLDASEGFSKSSGNEMITLKLKVFNDQGNSIVISDYLLESVAFKLRHCCEACGILTNYESGSLDAIDFEGRTGRLKLRIDVDKSGQYADKNSVADYVKPRAAAPTSAAPPARGRPAKAKPVAAAAPGSDLDDEIPF